MDLTCESLDQNLEEKRMFQRFPARFLAKVKDSRQDYGQVLSLRDVSAQGARIRSRENLNLRDRVTVEVKVPDQSLSMILKGDVVWVRQLDSAYCEAGIRFPEIHLARISHLYESCQNGD